MNDQAKTVLVVIGVLALCLIAWTLGTRRGKSEAYAARMPDPAPGPALPGATLTLDQLKALIEEAASAPPGL